MVYTVRGRLCGEGEVAFCPWKDQVIQTGLETLVGRFVYSVRPPTVAQVYLTWTHRGLPPTLALSPVAFGWALSEAPVLQR